MTVDPAPVRPDTARRNWMLGLMCFAQLLLQLDFAIVNVALASMQSDLGFAPADLQWVVTGYALAFGSLLLVGGTLGDRLGYRRTVVLGLVCFGLASAVGGFSVDPVMLIVARFVQGAAAALVAPSALAMITTGFADPTDRARALGVFQGATAAGASLGVVLGGVLVQVFGWRAVMLVNPPLIILLLVLVLARVPAVRGVGTGRIDVAGAGTVALAAAALVFGMSQGQQSGFGDVRVVAALGLSVLGFVAFLLVEKRSSHPMLPLRLLAERMRASGLASMFLVGAAVVGYVYFTALYQQRALGFSALSTGLGLLPATVLIMFTSIVLSRRILDRFGLGKTLAAGLVLMVVGQALFARSGVGGTYAGDVLPALVVNAFGMGLALPAISIAVNENAQPEQRGVVGGLLVFSQQLGAAIGLSVLAVIAAARSDAAGNLPAGYDLAYLVSSGACLLALAIVGATLVGGRGPKHKVVANPGAAAANGPA